MKLIFSRVAAAVALLASVAAGGCTQTTGSRTMARELAAQIGDYRKEQAARVDGFNQQYRDRFNQLMDQLVQLSDKKLEQGRDQDAQSLADDLISDDDTTLVGKLRNRFSTMVRSQRAAVASADDALTAARSDYVKSYTAASLDLTLLDTIQKDLNILALKESDGEIFDNAGKIIKKVIETRTELQKKAAEQSGKKSATTGS